MDGFFRRFRFADADLDEVHSQVAADATTIAGLTAAAAGTAVAGAGAADAETAAAAASPQTVATLIRLGFCLIPLDREAEAAAHLETALAMARQLGERDQEISALLHLGTARQYLGQPEEAQALFQAG